MHSSISNSEAAHPARTGGSDRRVRLAIIAAISSLAAVLSTAELASRYVFPRVSRIEARIRGDEREVKSLRVSKVGAPPAILLVGNSLLLRGLDYPKIREEMMPQAQVVRFVIENTEYLDWYYGLHHIFATGVHPTMVVLCLNLGQTVSPQFLGDYSARHLLGVSELLPVAHDAGMDATQTSGLILAHWSAFYSSRATIRNFILNVADPPFASSMHVLADSAGRLPDDDVLLKTARSRLDAIQQLCDQYGVPLVLLIPPALGRYNNLLATAAELQHISFEYPIPAGTMGPEFFADGTHLNQRGAALFTDAIARFLQARLTNTKRASAPRQRRYSRQPELPVKILPISVSWPLRTVRAFGVT